MWWVYICLIVVGWVVIQYGLLYMLLKFRFKKYSQDGTAEGTHHCDFDIDHNSAMTHSDPVTERFPKIKNWPKVAVVVPARNEALSLPACLLSLERLEYPDDKIEFLLADDHSEDTTATIIKEWALKAANRRQVKIDPPGNPGINGKAHALAQMISHTNADLLLFTDADCEVPTSWVKSMVSAYLACGKDCGVVTGITKVKPQGFLGKMQALDWWVTLGTVKVTSDFGFNLTAMGNNMLVTREAYNAVGGFDQVKMHLTEDLALSAAISRKGYRAFHHVDAECLITTLPERSLLDLMTQRRRWMHGVFLLPWYWQGLLMTQVGFYPAVFGLMLTMPWTGWLLWISKWFVQSVLIREFASKVETKIPTLDLLIFEFYYCCSSWSTVAYYFWPGKTNWKKRKYS